MVAPRIRVAVALGLVAFALAGCVRVLADTVVSADDTYSQHIIVAFSPEVAGQLGSDGGPDVSESLADITGGDQFADVVSRYPDKVSVTEYVDGDLTGVEVRIDALPLHEFNELAGQLTAGLGATAAMAREGDLFVVTLETSGANQLPTMGPGAADLALIESAIDFEVIYSFPGLVSEASAGRINGKSVTLGVSDMLAGEDIRIVAGAEPAIDWGPIIQWTIVGLGFAAILGGGSWLVWQDRRRQAAARLAVPTDRKPTDGKRRPGMLTSE